MGLVGNLRRVGNPPHAPVVNRRAGCHPAPLLRASSLLRAAGSRDAWSLGGQLFGALALLVCAACAPARHAVSPLAAYIPPGTDAIAYADLDRLRGTPLYAMLPVPDQLRQASAVLVVLQGKDWAIAAGGHFPPLPAGATLLGPDVAAAGAPALLHAMESRPDGGADLLAQAPADAPVWLVARGRATLPITGNLANFNRLLHQAEYTAIGLRVSDHLEIDAAAQCATPAQALHLEQNIRAIASLARLQSLTVNSDGVTVRITAALPFNALPAPALTR